MAERKIRGPIPTPDSLPFWEAAKEGRFLVRHCNACGKAHWYPRPYCPFCASGDTEYREASGKGTIYSYSVLRRVPEPYVLAYVTLDEGPRMMTNIVDCDLDTVRIGQKVTLAMKPSEDGAWQVPLFKPA